MRGKKKEKSKTSRVAHAHEASKNKKREKCPVGLYIIVGLLSGNKKMQKGIDSTYKKERSDVQSICLRPEKVRW